MRQVNCPAMSTAQPYQKPLPEILPETAEFWRAARRHELLLQRCTACGRLIYFPRLLCPHCLSQDLGWVKATGRGTVCTYTVIHQAAHESFAPDVPYVYAIIELEEGPRVISNVIHLDPAQVRIGMKVKVVFDAITPEVSIPKFEPA